MVRTGGMHCRQPGDIALACAPFDARTAGSSAASTVARCGLRRPPQPPQCRPGPGLGLMGAYVLRRLLALVPTLILASIIVFVTIRMIPGDVIDLMLSQNDIGADKLSRDQLVHALGLDRSMPEAIAIVAAGGAPATQ